MSTAREETSRLSALLGREHHAMAEFLVALADLNRRQLWAELGYPSLFSFLQRELRLSAGAAQYRKTAAELIQAFPEVETALRDGRLCLSSVNSVAKVITPENAADVLPRFFGKSARDAEFVAASIVPVENPPRDQGRCQWPVDGGGICESSVRVQLDHVVAFARGGRSTVEALRCLCAVHNDAHARQVFGNDWMDRFTRRSGGRGRAAIPTQTATATPAPTTTTTWPSTSTAAS